MIEIPGIVSIRSVSVKESKTTIKANIRHEDNVDSLTKKIEDPHPDLTDALQDLTAHFEDVLQLPSSWVEDVTVIGFTLKEKDEIEHLVVSATKPVAGNSKAAIDTPPVPSGSATIDAAVDAVQTEAKLAVEGKRAQASMFDSDDDDTGNEPVPAGDGAADSEPEVSNATVDEDGRIFP